MANPEVYDLLNPSPIPLKDLSSIGVAIELWRLDLNRRRMKNTVNEFDFSYKPESNITLRNVIPHIPSMIDDIIGKFLRELVLSTKHWLQYHFDNVFYKRNICNRQTDILNDFDDIVCDYDGSIDYVRTAARMMLCDRISPDEKFKIACLYSFEESIRRIWPTVERNFSLENIYFGSHPFLYYWVCRLKNQMERMPSYDEASVDGTMLAKCGPEIRSSFEYFWNRSSLKRRYEVAKHLCSKNEISFCGRFVLPKLNEKQLAEFVCERGADLISYERIYKKCNNVYPIWMYIKDVIDVVNFMKFVEITLHKETNPYSVGNIMVEKNAEDEKYYINDDLTACCKIWTSAPVEFKRSAIKNFLPKKRLFKNHQLIPSDPTEIRFIGTVLWDATSEEKKTFWLQNWLEFLSSKRSSDFLYMMEICLEKEDEISLFRRDTLAKYENLSETVITFLCYGVFPELTNLLNVCWPDTESCRDIKRFSLESNFLGERSVLSHFNILEPKLFREFIDDAYADDPKLADNFRNQLLSRPKTADLLVRNLERLSFLPVMKFIESMVPTDQNVEQLRKRFVDEMISLPYNFAWRQFHFGHFQDFLVWCLGSDEKVNEFKKMVWISPEEILYRMVRCENFLKHWVDVQSLDIESLHPPDNLDAFLDWYFNTEEEISEFRARMDNLFKKFTRHSVGVL